MAAKKERWKSGRQASGYWLYYLAQPKSQLWDLLLIRYPPGSYIVKHNDMIPGWRHYRLNIVLWGEQTFRCEGKPMFQAGPIVFFRPDIQTHEVLTSPRLRLVLSFGFRLKEKGP